MATSRGGAHAHRHCAVRQRATHHGVDRLDPDRRYPGAGRRGGISSEGKYEIKRGLRPGKYRVEIRSTRTLPRKVLNPTIPAELVDEEVSVIPEQYNSRTILIREISPGPNVYHFDLKEVATRK